MRVKGVFLAAILAAVLCVSGSVFAVLSGSGTAASPFLIQSRADFDEFANPANAALYWANGKYTTLMCNLDLSDTTYTQAVIAPDTSVFSSFQGTEFTGTFDGNGNVISNLTITASAQEYIGLFGSVGSGGQVKNLGVENVNLTGSFRVGGLVGSNSDGILTSCYATGAVTGTGSVGGLAGYNYEGSITTCYATGAVTGTGIYFGGLAGYNDIGGSITSCYATGAVTGGGFVGGLVGYTDHGSIICCYATGAVTGTGRVGGLAGYNDRDSITSCFWDIQTSGQTTSAGGTGKSTAEMKTLSTFINAGWDFVGEIANGLNDYWQMGANDYPRFPVYTWTLGGEGTSGNPYMVVTAADLGKVWLRPTAHYRLAGSLDLSGIEWSSAVVPSFSGIFDGNGLVISNLTINQPTEYFIGLFGRVNSGGQVNNLRVHVTITGRNYVGGIVGNNDHGSITSCYATGAVTGTGGYTGGLVGHNYGSIASCYATGAVTGGGGGLVGYNYGSITSCYATGTVTGGSAGGLAEYNYGSITFCYATGAVTGAGSVGGLVGENYYGSITSCYATGAVTGTKKYSIAGGLAGCNSGSNITFCYATGAVTGAGSVGGLVGYIDSGSITTCFWDRQTSGQTTSAGGTGKSTAEMKTLSTFINAGWDFVGEIANGLNDYWQMGANDYPRFPVYTWTLGGEGTSGNPYMVVTAADLGKVWLRPTAHYRLAGSLDLSGIEWSSAVVPSFSGIFDGNGLVISNLTINQPTVDYMGLFGRVNSGGQVNNLGVHVSLTGRRFVGGLAGGNYNGSITSCYATGEVNGNSSVGGLAGGNYNGSITSCYATSEVSGTSGRVGGLVGYGELGLIIFCYATGSVSSLDSVGGLVGYDIGSTLTACYAMGSVTGNSKVGGLVGIYSPGSITGSFWDMDASGLNDGVGNVDPDPVGVRGKTTTEMMTLSTFTSAGWDFSATDGDAADWMMLRENEDTPRLAWQEVFAGDVAGLYGVDQTDLMEVVDHWLEQGCPAGCEQADIDGSGTVDLGDFVIFSGEWMEGS